MANFAKYNTSDPGSGALPLLADADLTPTIILATGEEGEITGTVHSDQDGTLYIDQSCDFDPTDPDGTDGRTHWDYTATHAVDGGTQGTVISESVVARTARLRYTNGGTNQAHLRIFVRATG